MTRRTVNVDEKHHVVPKSYLKRFAVGGRLVLARRDDLEKRVSSTIDAAVKEGGFYNVAAGGGLPERQVEDILSTIEGRAVSAIDATLAGDFPPSTQTRLDVALFAALQTTRGWRFRRDFDQLAQQAARMKARETTREQVEHTLRRTGRSVSAKSIDHWHDVITRFEGVRAVPGRNMHLRYMLEGAVKIALPILLSRPWRLYEFAEPGIVTSDQPIAMWAPPGQLLGWAKATIIWLPLNPMTALAFGTRADEGRVVGTESRRRQVVRSVAEAAERWIVLTPGRDPLDGIDLRDFPPIEAETVAVESDGELIREVVRIGRPVPRP